MVSAVCELAYIHILFWILVYYWLYWCKYEWEDCRLMFHVFYDVLSIILNVWDWIRNIGKFKVMMIPRWNYYFKFCLCTVFYDGPEVSLSLQQFFLPFSFFLLPFSIFLLPFSNFLLLFRIFLLPFSILFTFLHRFLLPFTIFFTSLHQVLYYVINVKTVKKFMFI